LGEGQGVRGIRFLGINAVAIQINTIKI
jgi:hypothetical protein